MTPIPKRIEERLAAAMKGFQSTIKSAKERDANEADTVAIIRDVLADMLGFDKYSDISSETAVRGTYCDLAVKLDGKLQFVLEAKAIGIELKDRHLKQGVDYASHLGVEWVILTNAINWRVYKVLRNKCPDPIDQELILEIDFLNLNPKRDDDLSSLHRLTKEGWQKQILMDYAAERQALSKFLIAQIILSDPVLDTIRRELKRTCPDVKIKNEQIHRALEEEVLKLELVGTENERVDEAKRKVKRAFDRLLRERELEQTVQTMNITAPPVISASPCTPISQPAPQQPAA